MCSSGIVVYAMICLTDVCAMLHFVMLYHFARMVKLLSTGLEVAHESSCTSTGNMLIPVKTLHVPLEIKNPAEAMTAAIHWA